MRNPGKNALHVYAVNRFVKKRNRAGHRKDQKHRHQNAPVADAVHDKRFFRRFSRFVAFDVITDEQVRTQTHAFPADEHQQKIIRQNERQHREHKQIQIREKAIKTFIAVHITGRKNVNQQTDKRNETSVNSRKPVHSQTEIGAKIADLNPRPNLIENRFALRREQAPACGVPMPNAIINATTDEIPIVAQATAPLKSSLFIRLPNSQLITAPASGAKIIRLKKLFSVIFVK